VIPAAGGAVRKVAPHVDDARNATWSPDGRSLLLKLGARGLFIVQPFENSQPRAAEGGHVPSSVDDLNWTAAGLIYSDRDGWARNVHLLRLDNAGATPVLLTNGTEIADHVTASRNGRIAFASGSQRFNRWALPVDTSTGKVTGPPARLTDGFALERLPAQESRRRLSPDGKMEYTLVRKEGRCSIQAAPAGTSSPATVLYNSDTPRLSLAGVNPEMLDLLIERDRIVMILAEQTSNIWIADLHR
jgi:hypothetical protein